MAYTVKKLSELSGVSIRALHFYEERGLLKPSYYGSNGYRYYEEKELLELQQILFFKELGLSLKEIQKVIGKSDFDTLRALYSHKKALASEWEKIEKLLETVEKTIQHIQGRKKMKDIELFEGFTIGLISKSKGNEACSMAEEIVGTSVRNPTQNLEEVKERKAFFETFTKRTQAIFKELVCCMDKKRDPASDEVQCLIKKHHALADEIHHATQEVYKALATLYLEHPEFRKQLDPFHPKLADFLSKAMTFFAEEKLA